MVARLDALGQTPKWLASDALARSRAALNGGLARETWKYSSLPRALRALLDAPIANHEPVVHCPGGVKLSRFSQLDPPPFVALRTDRYPLAGIAATLSGDGWLVDIERSPDNPVVLTAAEGINAPIVLRVGPGCRLAVEELPTVGGFRATVRLLVAAHDSAISWNHAELVDDAEQWTLIQTQLASNANFTLRQYATGARLRRLDTHVHLLGNGSRFQTRGASVVNAGRHLDRQLVVEHQGRNTKSRTRLHNVAAGKSRCSFNGRIHIHRGASNADADLANRNLTIGGDAEVNSKPELEIYTDDVKCAHGATIGQLDDSALFYLRSRGLAEPLARRLLCAGFLTECIEGSLAPSVAAKFLRMLDDTRDATLSTPSQRRDA